MDKTQKLLIVWAVLTIAPAWKSRRGTSEKYRIY